jgi:diacylglycerol O-acyltransferase / wax synthase
MSAVTDDQTFNDPHEAADALVEAFGELCSAAGLSEQSSEPDLVAEHALR